MRNNCNVLFYINRDLIEQVTALLPEGCAIPAETTVRYSFAPRNVFSAQSQRYLSKIPMKHAVQRRVLRAFHVDAHYSNSIRKNLKHFAIKYKHCIVYVSCDDKAKVCHGEPGHFLATGTRNKKGIVAENYTISAEDHDTCHVGSITPSVILDIDIPEAPEDSFYQGQVSVTVKDSIFEPSSNFRFATELAMYLENSDACITK